MTETCMCWGITCGDGWYNILNTLCGQIQHHLKYNAKKSKEMLVEAVQVKEKFGGLRFYYHGGDEFISGLVSMAEAMSYKTCEECGSPGKPNNNGWVSTLCDPCRSKHIQIKKKKWAESAEKFDTVKTAEEEK